MSNDKEQRIGDATRVSGERPFAGAPDPLEVDSAGLARLIEDVDAWLATGGPVVRSHLESVSARLHGLRSEAVQPVEALRVAITSAFTLIERSAADGIGRIEETRLIAEASDVLEDALDGKIPRSAEATPVEMDHVIEGDYGDTVVTARWTGTELMVSVNGGPWNTQRRESPMPKHTQEELEAVCASINEEADREKAGPNAGVTADEPRCRFERMQWRNLDADAIDRRMAALLAEVRRETIEAALRRVERHYARKGVPDAFGMGVTACAAELHSMAALSVSATKEKTT